MTAFAPVNRRQLIRLVAYAPLPMLAGAAWGETFDYPTPATFDTIGVPRFRPVAPKAAVFPLTQVRLLDGPFLDAQRWNISYLKRLDVDRLLHSFRINAGLPSDAQPLGGWEAPDCELRGHFLGHYLSACAIGYQATGDGDLRARGERIVEALATCQASLAQGGYLSAFPLALFDRLAAGRPVWAPFYTLHKIMAGLLDMNQRVGNDQALTVLTGMAQWTDQWTAAREGGAMQFILENEFGGMNDILYRLAAATNDPRWLAVGDRFTKKRVFEPLANRKDMLRGLHANTLMPQVIGAATRHMLTGDARFDQVADFFWETVTRSRTYATGGSGNNEHWLTEPGLLAVETLQGDHHQECCCAYNMMKLGAQRFAQAPDAALMDYYERNLLNHRLGMIQPETGLTSYFLSMAPGAWKTLATENDTFWCCNGTAVEDFAQLGSMIYAHDAQGLYVNLFMASRLDWKERGLRLRQDTVFPAESRSRLTIEEAPAAVTTIRVRMPGWADERASVSINGRPIEASTAPGSYLVLRRQWRKGDVIQVDLPMTMRLEPLPDDTEQAALVLGPVVLAQRLPVGTIPQEMRHSQGPDVGRAPPPVAAAILPADIIDRLRPGKAPLTFTAQIGPRTVDFAPINICWDRFAVYSRIESATRA